MKNERLVAEIRQGNSELIPALWENVENFVKYAANRYLNLITDADYDMHGDLVNEAFLYLGKAVEKFDIKKGSSFISFYSFFLHTAFNSAYYGGTTQRKYNDPINSHISLDAPLQEGDAEGLTLADMLIDSESEKAFAEFEQRDYWHSVNSFLRDCIIKVQDQIGKDILMYMLDNNCNHVVAARQIGVEGSRYYIQYHFENGVRQLKRIMHTSNNIKRTRAIGIDYLCFGSGLSSYKRHRFTSCVELAILRKEEMKML